MLHRSTTTRRTPLENHRAATEVPRNSGHPLAVACYLRATFANDGEEIAEVIARHYLDALSAAPDDRDAVATGEAALSMFVRAAERAGRAGVLANACGDATAGEPGAADAFSQAIEGLRAAASPYHLAHGLLDHAAYLAHLGDAAGAAVAADEARSIGQRLRCPPLVRQAESLAKQLANVG